MVKGRTPGRLETSTQMIQSFSEEIFTAVIVQWQNAGLWHRMSWVRPPLTAPKFPGHSHTTQHGPMSPAFQPEPNQAGAINPGAVQATSPRAVDVAPAWWTPFVPRRFLGIPLTQPDVQTLLANFLPRKVDLPPAESVLVPVGVQEDGTPQARVLCHCHWQAQSVRARRLTVLLVHGLEGSSQSQYMLGNADRAWRSGWNVVRMNMRNCGGTDALAPTLYHSGLSGDVLAVAQYFVAREALQAVALVGYSMGGNLVLKCVGELGTAAPPWLRAAVGVSPAIDLAAGSSALHSPRNRIYEWNFLQNMLRRYRRKAALFPGWFSMENFWKIRSLRDFDEYLVAPNCGFRGADDYYARASASRVVDHVSVPTLLLHAADDPFVRLVEETRTKLRNNPAITFVETKHGGHCAFLDAPQDGHDGHWAERTLQNFLAAQIAPSSAFTGAEHNTRKGNAG